MAQSLFELDNLLEAFTISPDTYTATKHDIIEMYLNWLAHANDIQSSSAQRSHPTEMTTVRDVNEEDEDDSEEVRQQDEAEMIVDVKDESHYDARSRWARSARQYLRVLTLHWRSIYTLVYPGPKIEPHIGDFLSHFTFNLIDVRAKEQDNRLQDLMPCIMRHPFAQQQPRAQEMIRE